MLFTDLKDQQRPPFAFIEFEDARYIFVTFPCIFLFEFFKITTILKSENKMHVNGYKRKINTLLISEIIHIEFS